MSEILSPKVFLVRRTPSKLSPYEQGAIESYFGDRKPQLIRMEIEDAHSHLSYCKKNVDRESDIVFLPRCLDFEALAGFSLLAVESGYVHAFFGKEGLDLRKLTGVTIASEKL